MPHLICYVCESRSDMKRHLSFHSFPKNAIIRKKWLHFCDLNEHDDVKTLRVCSQHFPSNVFHDRRQTGGRRFLIKGAVPSIKKQRKKCLEQMNHNEDSRLTLKNSSGNDVMRPSYASVPLEQKNYPEDSPLIASDSSDIDIFKLSPQSVDLEAKIDWQDSSITISNSYESVETPVATTVCSQHCDYDGPSDPLHMDTSENNIKTELCGEHYGYEEPSNTSFIDTSENDIKIELHPVAVPDDKQSLTSECLKEATIRYPDDIKSPDFSTSENDIKTEFSPVPASDDAQSLTPECLKEATIRYPDDTKSPDSSTSETEFSPVPAPNDTQWLTPKGSRVITVRYPGDIKSSDLATPRRAKESLDVLRRVIMVKNKKLKVAAQKIRRLEKRVVILNELLSQSQKQNLLSKNAAKNNDIRQSEQKSMVERAFSSKNKSTSLT